VPFLKKYHRAMLDGSDVEDAITPEEYELQRASYVRSGAGTPPPGATPLPDAEGG